MSASIKLTGPLRKEVTLNLLVEGFADEVVAHMDARAEFAAAVYRDIYGPTVRTRMEKLPAGWLNDMPSICVQFGDGAHFTELPFNGHFPGSIIAGRVRAIRERPEVRRLVLHKDRGCAKAYERDHTLALQHRALKEATKDLTGRIHRAKDEIIGVLIRFTTTARARESWPEIAPFLDILPRPPAEMPAAPLAIRGLNSTLNLSTGDAA